MQNINPNFITRISSIMNWISSQIVTIVVSFLFNSVSCEYSETVSVTYLPNSNILTEVAFKLSKEFPLSNEHNRDFGYFPSLIYSLPAEFGLQQGRISFTRGLWEPKLWGKASSDPTSSGFQFHGHFKNHFNELT